jgi:hypothetical protein
LGQLRKNKNYFFLAISKKLSVSLVGCMDKMPKWANAKERKTCRIAYFIPSIKGLHG